MGIGGAERSTASGSTCSRYIDKTKFDMSQVPGVTVSLYNVGGEGQVGIPFAIYPSVLFYKAGLFEEAGLAEPPHEWGAGLQMPDGSGVPWDYDTATSGQMLTVDENGKDATDPAFDPENVVQWGLEPQRDDLRQSAPTGRPASSRPATTARPPRSRPPGRRRGSGSTTRSGATTSR